MQTLPWMRGPHMVDNTGFGCCLHLFARDNGAAVQRVKLGPTPRACWALSRVGGVCRWISTDKERGRVIGGTVDKRGNLLTDSMWPVAVVLVMAMDGSGCRRRRRSSSRGARRASIHGPSAALTASKVSIDDAGHPPRPPMIAGATTSAAP